MFYSQPFNVSSLFRFVNINLTQEPFRHELNDCVRACVPKLYVHETLSPLFENVKITRPLLPN